MMGERHSLVHHIAACEQLPSLCMKANEVLSPPRGACSLVEKIRKALITVLQVDCDMCLERKVIWFPDGLDTGCRSTKTVKGAARMGRTLL